MGTMRHPLRNEFDEFKVQLERIKNKPNHEGVQARAMLALIPPLIDVLEAERDKGTDPLLTATALRAVAGNITHQAVQTCGARLGSPQATLERFLLLVMKDVEKRLAPQSKLILPGLPH